MVTFATPLVAVLLAAGGVPQWADPGQPGFYVVAHMCNNAASVDWAISQGANGIENDIRFDAKTGQPTEFRHGGTCDCVCNPVPSSMNVCKVLNGDCEAREAAYAHLQRLGKLPWLSLMILDSKIPDTGAFNAAEAGKAIVKLCDIHLFGFQFKGKVIISNGKRTANGVAYIKAVAAAVAKSPNKDHYYVGFDQDSDLAATGALASQWSKHVIAGAGISACAPGAYTKEMAAGKKLVSAHKIGMAYTWTLDSTASMAKHIDAGAGAILSNVPNELLGVMRDKGLKLARPDSPLPGMK